MTFSQWLWDFILKSKNLGPYGRRIRLMIEEADEVWWSGLGWTAEEVVNVEVEELDTMEVGLFALYRFSAAAVDIADFS